MSQRREVDASGGSSATVPACHRCCSFFRALPGLLLP